jgi:hypothetical protein
MSAPKRGIVLGALVGAVLLAGCGPVPTVIVTNAAVAFEGGSCSVTVSATSLPPNTTWGVGMYTTGSPVVIGYVTSNSSGSVLGKILNYPATTLPRGYSNLRIEVYADNSGTLGAGITSAPVAHEVCLPTGLQP